MTLKMKELPESEKPYEKMELYGAKKLSNTELLAIIIKNGTKDISALTLAQEVLALDYKNENLSFLSELDINDLIKIKGIGKIKAIQLLAVVELAKRINQPKKRNEYKIKTT